MTDKPTYEELEIKGKELEKALQKSEKKFKDFYENSVMGLFQSEIDGRLLMLNRKCAEIFGYESPKQALEAVKNASEIYVRPKERLTYIADIHKHGFVRDMEIECKKSNGDLFWVNINMVKSVEKDGRVLLKGFLVDVTDRKFAEAELEKFKTISDQANYGTAIVDLGGNFIYVNENFAMMHGFYPDELTGKNLGIFHNKDQMGHVNRLNKRLLNEGGYSAEEVWHVRKDGSVFPTIMNGHIIRKDDGSPYLMVATAIDITDRKLADEALKESEAKYRLIFNTAPIGIFHYNNHGVITVCNEQLAKIAGSTIETIIGFNLLKNVKNEHMLTAVRDSLAGKTSHLEGKYTTLTGGKTTYTKADFVPLISDGATVDGGIGVVEDVYEKIIAAKALRESQHQLQSIIDKTSAVIYLKDKQGKFILINRQFETLFHITQEEIIGRTDYDVFPKEISDRLGENDLKVFNAGVPVEFEERVPHDDGVHTYISIKFPIQDVSGATYGVCGISSDISGRKKLEAALKEQEAKYRLIVETAPVGIFHFNQDGVITECNKKYVEISGSSYEALIGFDLLKRVKNQGVLNAHKTALEGKHGQYEGEYTSITGDKTVMVEIDAVPIFLNDRVSGGVCVIEEITARIRAEMALQESEEKYRGILENIEDGYYEVDTSGNMTFFNKSLSRILGYLDSELMGTNYRSLMDKENAEKVFQEFNRVFKTGQHARGVDWKIIQKDGSERYIDTSISVIRDTAGDVIGFGGITRDVTEKKLAENELTKSRERLRELSAYLQSAREKERTNIAREIHDELGQALTAIKLEISWVKGKISKNQKTIFKKIDEIIALADNAIKSVQRIISELRPGLLNDLGLTSAMEWQLEEFEARTGIKADITIDPEELVLNDALSTTIFRIFQETLTNITRHSEATYIKVRLKEIDSGIELIVRDNGIGITEDQIAHRDSFGLLGMMERAHAAGGEIKISGSPGRGTKVAVRVPVDA